MDHSMPQYTINLSKARVTRDSSSFADRAIVYSMQ